ncbi:Flap endonuclease GEN -like protein 1 [Escovopsis weberi]|uniref:Flap endonuclease GEN-like protein 1 n=1 Tax=Escovopsis weberi TaxID=150374 RepID=A0A0M9VTK2_ESCWE|nr:Flap endonuclease GEN -like protein 1 [Escovopsis weberi]
MGIKGLYSELGPGKRVSLARLAAESLESQGRPLRLAIDVAIWQFQSHAARGGTNPAVRTLFYRLVRLLGTPVQPVFVFDGPNKPTLKRNKRSGRADGVAVAQAKRLIQLFGFVAHDAPGEAEAECAYLQKHGVVDAVLSEDVDTIMFGCTRTLRNWSAESSRSTIPTHVSLYDVDETDGAAWAGLGREGMVLVALMSGGDYLPGGVPGCGVKTACEAARAGFGAALCRLKASDAHAVERWRESLAAELRTNESGYFRTRHMKLAIPDDFPDREILRYYTHPVVSTPAALEAVARRLGARQEIHLDALREFAREAMDWGYRGGALKFIRTMSRGMLVHRLQRGGRAAEGLVQAITLRRTHADCDGEPEMRLAYVPGEVVPLDLSTEGEPDVSYGRAGLALNSDDEFDVPLSSSVPGSSQADGVKVVFDPARRELAWVLESVARKSLPELVRAFELKQATKSRTKSPKGISRARAKKSAPVSHPHSHGSIERFVRIAKPSSSSSSATAVAASSSSSSSKAKAKDAIAAVVEENLLQPSFRATSLARPLPNRPSAPRRVLVRWTPAAGAAERASPRQRQPKTLSQAMGASLLPFVQSFLRAVNRKGATAREKDKRVSRTLVQASMDSFTQVVAPSASQSGCEEQSAKGVEDENQEDLDGAEKTKKANDDDNDEIIILISDDDDDDDDDDDNKDAPSCVPSNSSSAQAENARSTASGSRNQEKSQGEKQATQEKIQEKHQVTREKSQEVQKKQENNQATQKTQTKTLLVPSACGAGFKEIHVSEGEREARIRREERRLARAGCRTHVVRLSDVDFVDLSGE